MELPQCTTTLPEGSGQWNSCIAPPRCPGAVGSATPAVLCHTPCAQWEVQLRQCTASLSGGSAQWNFCNALPHCLRAVGSATPAMHCLTVWGQCVVELLQCTAPLSRGSGQWNFCNALPHCLGQWAVQLLHCTAPLSRGSGPCNSCNTLSQCLGAVGIATPAMHCHPTWGQWAVKLLQCTATPPAEHPQCAGPPTEGTGSPAQEASAAVMSGIPAMDRQTAYGQCAVELLQCTATLPGGSGQCNACNTLPYRLGTGGSGTFAMRGATSWGDGEARPRGGGCLKSSTLAMHCHTAWARGQCNSCNALPHRMGAVGSATRAMHCLTAWGPWAMELLQCTASLPRGSG